jgi:[ribosomal protein S5]-alanine N-acetyltransferase
MSDAALAFEYVADREFFRYLPVDYVNSLEDEERFVASQLALDWDTHPSWAITVADVPIGGINVRIDPANETAEMGYGIARRVWGQGLVTEAAAAVMDWTFSTYSVARLAATADPRNIGSWRVMEKLAMTREGILRGHRRIRGERADTVVYSILAVEWAERRKRPI